MLNTLGSSLPRFRANRRRKRANVQRIAPPDSVIHVMLGRASGHALSSHSQTCGGEPRTRCSENAGVAVKTCAKPRLFELMRILRTWRIGLLQARGGGAAVRARSLPVLTDGIHRVEANNCSQFAIQLSSELSRQRTNCETLDPDAIRHDGPR